jgi:hypothetical protein
MNTMTSLASKKWIVFAAVALSAGCAAEGDGDDEEIIQGAPEELQSIGNGANVTNVTATWKATKAGAKPGKLTIKAGAEVYDSAQNGLSACLQVRGVTTAGSPYTKDVLCEGGTGTSRGDKLQNDFTTPVELASKETASVWACNVNKGSTKGDKSPKTLCKQLK